MNLFKRITQHNWPAILYFNYKMLPLFQAIKLPFDFYHKVRFVDLTGMIILNSNNIRRGMLHWGLIEDVIFPYEECVISIKGKLIINADSLGFGTGTTLEICNDSTLELNDDIVIAPRTKILTSNLIKIGDHARIGWECQILDSDFHFLRNILTGEVKRNSEPIFIGNNCWIGNHTTINKGTNLPANCIVASNSLCNKDYRLIVSEYSILGGIPAKLIQRNFEMIIETVEPELIKKLLILEKTK